jgi:hydroxypyruvate isomerase
MPKLCANLTMMFQEIDFLDRFSAAADAGFSGVEILFPYAFDTDKMATLLDLYQLELCLINLFPGEWDKGERGFGALPDKRRAFYHSVDLGVKYARDMNAAAVQMMADIAAPDAQNRQCYIDNVRYAADLEGEVEKILCLEPISTPTIPCYFLNNTWQAADLMDEIAHPVVKLQLDIFHHQMTHGDVLGAITDLFDRVGHMQIAGVPDRHEPDVGGLDYRAVLSHLDDLEYNGWVGCEYSPKSGTKEGLSWIRPYQS